MRSPVSGFFERPGSEPDSGHATAEGASGSPAWIGFENAQRASCCKCDLTAVRAVITNDSVFYRVPNLPVVVLTDVLRTPA
jgi:hypothetical protein